MSFEDKISEICEIEAEMYLDYYNGEYTYEEFKGNLKKQDKNIIDKGEDLLNDHSEKDIMTAITEQCKYYKKEPQWFGEDDESSYFSSGYYESNKNKKYPFYEKCGHTKSLLREHFKDIRTKTAKKLKTFEHVHKKRGFSELDEGVKETISHYVRNQRGKRKKSKRKKKNTKRKKSKRKKNKSKLKHN